MLSRARVWAGGGGLPAGALLRGRGEEEEEGGREGGGRGRGKERTKRDAIQDTKYKSISCSLLMMEERVDLMSIFCREDLEMVWKSSREELPL